MEKNWNYFAAIAISVAIVYVWQLVYVQPRIEAIKEEKKTSLTIEKQSIQNTIVPIDNRAQALSRSPRVEINSPSLAGSINLKGAQFDDLSLKGYRVDVSRNSPMVALLNPLNTENAYFAELNYISTTNTTLFPNENTVWNLVSGQVLTPSTPVKLAFKSANNILFERIISLDENYLFTIVDTITNNGTNIISFSPYGKITRYKLQKESNSFGVQEGFIAVLGDQSLIEKKYSDIEKSSVSNFHESNSWLGISDKYWASAFIPPKEKSFQSRFDYFSDGRARYQANFKINEIILSPGKSSKTTNSLFVGAKELPIIQHYEKELEIPRFEMLIDWGWFYFIAKPMFALMSYFYNLVGNFGIAIMLTTVFVKTLFFPLAKKQYVSTANMKNIQPKIDALREQFKQASPQVLQKEMLQLYKTHKINPLAGCWPILLQIPVFFAIYKVISISLEMRHAPFFGWIQDLAAPDPTNIFTLFGILPFQLPGFIHVGIWPIIMSISMFLQMKMSPPPTDKGQAIVLNWMPVVFVFALSSFPAGLIIYWSWSNIISIIQQTVIMKMYGAKIDIIDRLRSMFSKSSNSK
ncbi:insertase [Candidatus Liberibacter solanacearum]|uniref:Membrane protein insertase YidC n=1 Tax=Candidatus Liberibacter solanacearum TaxID=556287 RepID=A0A095BEG1_9HYPH|nr:membrane protein insertase YidC [Candidatus Liberibacter solanacearum]KGB27198.1 insertase [Candidatus Liberibacter solanacearum]KJZ81009.1 insertase [Candidatus Liberibacter solanacearum]KJZ82182.1 Inner membrane protein translocase component YidC, long form [Candidatus Liberibacter solanacearum]KQC49385.1 insertase [Candidatus Liberibacter solanacearum]